MGKYTFWLLLVACLLAAGAVYVLEVAKVTNEVEDKIGILDSAVARGGDASAKSIGPKSMETAVAMHEGVEKSLSEIQKRFSSLEEDNLERWFDDLDTPWRKSPLREEFKRQYNLGVDELVRDASGALEKHGFESPRIHLLQYEWMSGEELPAMDAMRAVQREFWIQDRIIRAFARVGGALTRPLRGGERQKAVGHSAAGGFDRIRYDVQLHCSAKNLRRVLHALDRPFVVKRTNGDTETMGLNLIVDNVAVRRINIDTATANRYSGEPPVEVSFFVTLLDYEPGSKKAGH